MISLVVSFVGLGVLGPLAHWLERRFPLADEPRTRSLRIDAAYWLLTPLFTGVLTRGALVFAALLAVFLVGGSPAPAHALEALARIDPIGIGASPLWFQAPIGLVLADLLSYFSHRMRHAVRPLSRLHDVHHAPDGLSWSAAARMHPLDDVLDNTLVFFPLLGLGFAPTLVLLLGPALLLHTVYLHANVRIPLGPLDQVIATPAFHRAHHAASGEAGNFGGVFTVWDRAFGTLRPSTRTEVTGLPPDARLPETMLAQLARPLFGRLAKLTRLE